MAWRGTTRTSVIMECCWGFTASPADTQVQHLGFYWHLPTSVCFMEGSLTHQNQQESLTTGDFHQFRIGAGGTKLQSPCKTISRLSLQPHRSCPLSLRAAQCQASSCRLPQHPHCCKCIFINPQPAGETQVSSGGWKMSTILPRMWEHWIQEWITKIWLCLSWGTKECIWPTWKQFFNE